MTQFSMIPADIKHAPLQVYVWQSQLNKGNDKIETIGAPSNRYGFSSARFLSNHCWLTTLQHVQPKYRHIPMRHRLCRIPYASPRKKLETYLSQFQYRWANQIWLGYIRNDLWSQRIHWNKQKYMIQLNMKLIRLSKNELDICRVVQLPISLKNIFRKWRKENATQLFETADLNG